MKTIKVYSGPGYPIDPAKEDKRRLAEGVDYLCKMIPPRPRRLRSEEITLTFGSQKEADAYLAFLAKYRPHQ